MNFAPTRLLGGARLARVGQTRSVKATLLAIFSVALVGCSFVPSIETNPKKYSTLVTNWTPTGLVAHFPNPLPVTASNVKLSAFPGFLQGGAWFQVRLTLPEAEVSKVYDDVSKIAKTYYDGGRSFTLLNSKVGGLPGTDFYTSGNRKQIEFPRDYRVFVIDAQSRGGNAWDHGKSYGVIVSKLHNEVIYYAENW